MHELVFNSRLVSTKFLSFLKCCTNSLNWDSLLAEDGVGAGGEEEEEEEEEEGEIKGVAKEIVVEKNALFV